MSKAPITWTNAKRKLSQLKNWADNPARIDADSAKRLEESLEEFGQVAAIAIEPDNSVVDGHQRKLVWSASKKFGANYKVDVRIASRKLTTKERQRLAILLRSGAVGQYDWGKIAEWDAELVASAGLDAKYLESLRADEAAVMAMLEKQNPIVEETQDAGELANKADELQAKWQVCKGDLWTAGKHRILCGDSTNAEDVARVMDGDIADLWIIDSPYGIEFSGSNASTLEWQPIEGDKDNKTAEKIMAQVQENQNAVVFGANCFPSLLPHRGRWLCWDKRITEEADRMLGSPFELAWMNKRSGFDVMIRVLHGGAVNSDGGRRYHPTQKPVALYSQIVDLYKSNLIYDPFLGSGTSLIAAEQTGRIGRGIEIEPKYVSVSLERLSLLGLDCKRIASAT